MSNFICHIGNIAERRFIGRLLVGFLKPRIMPTINWAKSHRIITNQETSFSAGYFDPDVTPYMEYVYECLDNPYMPEIVGMKSARIAWTETLNNYRGNRIATNPTEMLLGFATREAARDFAKKKLKNFFDGVSILKQIVNKDIAENRKSLFDYSFENGSLKLVTLGSIVSQKSNNYEYIEIEEPDDAKDDVAGQGDTFSNLKERQKLVPKTRKKFIFGGTPTFKDFSRVEKALKSSNHLIFKAECHECGALVPMDHTGFDNIKYTEYPNKKMDDVYGKFDPFSAIFICPNCKVEWSFEQKNLNIRAGKKHGFIDHTGNFSKGWHPTRPHIVATVGFSFSELLSPFPGSDFVEIAKSEILALKDLVIGKELLMKSYVNNRKGQPYASGFSAMEAEEMQLLRLNYPEHICPMDALAVTVGIDVQDNRFAIVLRGWCKNGSSYLITWKEIFGDVLNRDDPVWDQLAEETVLVRIPHASGKMIQPVCVGIDSADNTELVYYWVLKMQQYNQQVIACRGVKDLRFSEDEIYREPAQFEVQNAVQVRRSLAERMGVTVYHVGAHRAHGEILRRINLRKMAKDRPDEYKSDLYFWNEQSYGSYEEQMTSCRKIFDIDRSGNTKEVFRLIPGKRKEAIDAEKLALHASYAAGIRNYGFSHWKALEDYYFK